MLSEIVVSRVTPSQVHRAVHGVDDRPHQRRRRSSCAADATAIRVDLRRKATLTNDLKDFVEVGYFAHSFARSLSDIWWPCCAVMHSVTPSVPRRSIAIVRPHRDECAIWDEARHTGHTAVIYLAVSINCFQHRIRRAVGGHFWRTFMPSSSVDKCRVEDGRRTT